MRKRPPFGFYLAGALAAAFAVLMARGALLRDSWTEGDLAMRGCALLLACLAAVVTEALWTARPWAYRSSLALATLFGGMVLAMGTFNGGFEGLTGTIAVLAFVGTVVVPLVVYVRERSADLFGTRTPRRPRPVLAAAARGRWLHKP